MVASSISVPMRQRVRPANPLLVVCAWELRRLLANRFGWAGTAAIALFFALLLWFKHFWNVSVTDGGAQLAVVGSSAVGMVHEVVFVLLLLYGMFLPFIAADGVARDYRQRVHELIMTTAMPSWAYVGGRYLARLLVSLGLAGELLVVTWVVDTGLHATSTAYPAPDVAALLAVWSLTVLPATVLLASVSFALGTRWTRWATALKLAVLVAWVALAAVGDSLLPSWFPYWNPTSYSLATASQVQLLQQYRALTLAGGANHLAMAQAAQSRLPQMQPWLLPHAGLIALGFALALATAGAFRSFRDVM